MPENTPEIKPEIKTTGDNSKKYIIRGFVFGVLGSIILTLVALAGSLAYVNFFAAPKSPSPVVDNKPATDEPYQADFPEVIFDDTSSYTTSTGSDWIGKYLAYDDFRDYTGNFRGVATPLGNRVEIQTEWKKIAYKLTSADIKSVFPSSLNIKEGDIFEIGKIIKPEILKDKIIYYFTGYLGPATISKMVFYDDKRNGFIMLNQNNDCMDGPSWYQCFVISEILKEPKLVGIIDFVFFPGLENPEIINIPNSESKLIPSGVGYTDGRLNPVVEAGGLDLNKKEVVTPPEKIIFTSSEYGPIYFDRGCFLIIKADGSYQNYDLMPYFMKLDAYEYTADIIWSDGSKNTDKYIMFGYDLTSGTYCGRQYTDCSNIVDGQKWFDESKLVEIGRTNKNEPVYELSDKVTNSFYKLAFEKSDVRNPDFDYEYDNNSPVYLDALRKVNEELMKQFLAGRPLFFWKDQWGNWRVYKNAKFRSAAECGKPVIYLYPEKEADVKVQVEPNGGFSKTEPLYDDGWFVRATPESSLFNFQDGKTYPYLFWEGKAYNYSSPDKGFVLSKGEVAILMPKILGRLGLNDKETKDFLEFWQPRLEAKPYVFVTFLPQRDFDKIAPLTVFPRPDKVIRVFMDYHPLENFVEVEPLRLGLPPARSGFTVVEWGGRLLK